MRRVSAAAAMLALACTCRTPAPAAGSAAGPAAPAAPSVKQLREPTAAGRFYPAEPGALTAQVTGFLARAKKVVTGPVKMVLVPHAGLEFSGQVAADAFKQLGGGFERAVVVAGNHNGAANYVGLAVDRATHYRVPGLEVPVARAATELHGRPGVVDVPAAHTMHMVEIELPFLRAVNGRDFELVPIVVGRLDGPGARAAAAQLAKLDDGKTVFVFSVDLSHYYPYDQAVALDRPCLDALVRSDAEAVASCDTDATQVLFLMNELSARLSLTPRLVSYANSGDTSGDRSRVVGYGALVYEDRFELGKEEGAALVSLARQALETRVRDGKKLPVPAGLVERWPRLGAQRGAFVTLRERGELRGCIGTLEASEPLAQDVVDNAINAAVADPRFQPVTPGELGAIELSISVLTAPRPLTGLSSDALVAHLTATHPGLIIEYHGRRSTFLPSVWEELPATDEFLGHLCRKQGAPADCWRDPSARFETYESQHLAE